jgi:hypothetical protein
MRAATVVAVSEGWGGSHREPQRVMAGDQHPPDRPRWTFLTAHALVVLHVDTFPNATLREIAAAVGRTDRQVARVLKDLEADGYIRRERVGRNARTTIERERPVRETPGCTVGDLLAALEGNPL